MKPLLYSNRAVDPDSLNPDSYTDPDPAFQVNPDADLDLVFIRIFDDNKLKKKLRRFFFLFLIKKIAIYFCPSYRIQEKFSALKRENLALQKMKFINLFLCLWVIFLPSWNRIRIQVANPDPETDPGTPLNPDQIRIHSTESNGRNRPR
jgi:hypothetical protein